MCYIVSRSRSRRPTAGEPREKRSPQCLLLRVAYERIPVLLLGLHNALGSAARE